MATPTLEERPLEQRVPLDLYTAEAYFEVLKNSIAETKSGDRVALTAMCFEPTEQRVEETFDELQAAAKRGVNVVVALDAYTFMMGNSNGLPGPAFLPLPFGQGVFRRRQQAIEELRTTPNMHIGITNQPSRLLTNPCADRSHLKISVVNNSVYLGGPNMHGTERVDMAVGFEDAAMADRLFGIVQSIAKTEDTKAVLGKFDHRYPLDSETDILIDAGQQDQSLILDTALQLIDEAEEWIVTAGQYFPHGETGKRLARAAMEREVSVFSAHNHPRAHGGLNGLWQRGVQARERRRLPPRLFIGQLPDDVLALHTALIATDKAGMKCSHNLIDTGVKWRTPEQALIRRSPLFGEALRSLVLEQFLFTGLALDPPSVGSRRHLPS